MSVRVAINGFGRTGRAAFRAAYEREAPIEWVAINDVADPELLAHLLRHDTVYGAFPGTVEARDGALIVDRHRIEVPCEPDVARLPWRELGVEVVIDSTGLNRSREAAAQHLDAGAAKVIISAPAKDPDVTVALGVNFEQVYQPAIHRIISNASCTTNCLAPVAMVLHEGLGIRHGLMTTVHAYTNDQNLLDLTHKDLRRARAGAANIVPSSTGAAKATSLVMASMKGRLDGMSLRIPLPVGSITDFTAVVKGHPSVEEVNAAFAEAAAKPPLDRVLEYTEDPIVSSDIVGSRASCTLDAQLTVVMPVNEALSLVKTFGWYDNEWGYSHRLVDLTVLVGG